MILEISAIVVSAAILLLVLFLIPSILQMRRTAKSLEETSQSLNSRLPVILARVEEITSDVTVTSGMMRYNVRNVSQEVDRVVDLMHQGLDLGETFQETVKHPFTESVITIAAAIRGAQTFFQVLRK